MYCRKHHKEVGYFNEKPCFISESDYDAQFNLSNETKQESEKMEEIAKVKTKVCKDCGRELPIEEFQRQAKSKDGYMHICKECKNKRMIVALGKEKPAKPEKKVDNGFPPTQDKYDRLQEYTPQELVDHLRFLGWDVTCTRTINL